MRKLREHQDQFKGIGSKALRLLGLLTLIAGVVLVAVTCFGLWYTNSYEAGVFNGGGHHRPSGVVGFGGPCPLGVLRLVHIEHSHGEVRTTVTFIFGIQRHQHTFHGLDQRPPQEPVDVAGQWVIDQYNSLKCSL